jgi:transposase InsO family protein
MSRHVGCAPKAEVKSGYWPCYALPWRLDDVPLRVIQAPKLEPRIMRYELTDYEWTAIKPFLPNKPRGVPRVNGQVFTRRLRAMGIRDRPISPGSPWQNGIAERFIGTLRRECLDQFIIFSAAHLRLVLAGYATYYNQTRTHLTLRKEKDTPSGRAVQQVGRVVAIPVLGGLHHRYARI